MQTFLPYADFTKTFQILDSKRLGKQRVEALQLIRAIEGTPRADGKPYSGWIHHPCTIMWKPYPLALKVYFNLCVKEWQQRGFRNNLALFEISPKEVTYPSWLGYEPFHASHRSNLLRKDLPYYSRFNWIETPTDLYYWLDETNKWYVYERASKTRIYIDKKSLKYQNND